jgi:serine/threonine-protein kinase
LSIPAGPPTTTSEDSGSVPLSDVEGGLADEPLEGGAVDASGVSPIGDRLASVRDPDEEFEHSRRELNIERSRTVASVLIVANALAVFWRGIEANVPRVTEDSPRSEALAMVHALSLPVALVGYFASSERGAKTWWVAGLRDRAGEFAVAHLCAMGAALSLLALPQQREPYALVLAMVAGTMMFRARRSLLALAVFGTSALTLAAAMALLGTMRALPVLWVSLFFAAACMKVSSVLWDSYANEVRVRADFERLNRELDQMVQEQTASVIAQSSEVERLNAVLSERVRETSRELSVALARLAKGERLTATLARGTVLAERVEIVRPIGRGAMGVVYEATDLTSSSRVAVKVLSPKRKDDLDAMFRLFREAEAIASVEHPTIVRTEHVGVSEDGLLFIVLQYVDGRTLASALETDGRWPIDRVARLGSVLFAALEVAHRTGITHRDIKPENLMLVPDSPGLKLLDFGLARIREAASPISTGDDHILGTPAFMSPEQVLAPETVGPASDVYTAALVLYQLAAGCAPYRATRANEWVARHAFAEPTPLKSVLGEVDPLFEETLMACLSKKIESRPTALHAARAFATVAIRLGASPLEVAERARSARIAQRRATPASGQIRVVKPIEPSRKSNDG